MEGGSAHALGVLLVDDEQIERRGLISMLTKAGYGVNVFEARNGAEALDTLRQKDVAIMITDIKMPVMDGITLIQEAHGAYPCVRVIIHSGYADFGYAQKAIACGVASYLLKPLRYSDFLEAFGKVYDGCHDLAERLSAGQGGGADDASARQTVRRVIQIIHNEYCRHDLSLNYLAKQVFLSPNYLSNMFTKDMGYGISKYITQCRLERARELLGGTFMRISDIANATGFSNGSYFATSFKECYGCSPLEYRKMRRDE